MRRWILLAANLYPRAWRERYGEEFQALLEDVNPGWRELADVLGGALKMQIAKGTTYLKIIAALAVAGMIVAAAASFAVPRRYVSSAALRIAAQADATRIAGIAAVLLSRWYLTKLITGPLDLYSEERRRMPLEDVILQAQRDIQIGPMAAASPNGAPTLGVSFAYPDKEKAQAVVRELAAEMVRVNVAVNRNRQESWRMAWPSEPMPPGQEVEILSMASLPQKPVSPNRFAFAALGLGAGLLLGLLTAEVDPAGSRFRRCRRRAGLRVVVAPSGGPHFHRHTAAQSAILGPGAPCQGRLRRPGSRTHSTPGAGGSQRRPCAEHIEARSVSGRAGPEASERGRRRHAPEYRYQAARPAAGAARRSGGVQHFVLLSGPAQGAGRGARTGVPVRGAKHNRNAGAHCNEERRRPLRG